MVEEAFGEDTEHPTDRDEACYDTYSPGRLGEHAL